jgi:predicted O-methyltransferase YrrM
MPQQPSNDVAPIAEIIHPKVDVKQIVDPIPAILQSPEFAETKRFFATSPSAARCPLSDVAQALLYSVVRNARPHHVVEIGTCRGGTTEGLARALQSNGFGTLHTGSPYDAARFLPLYHRWPEGLRRNVRYYQVDSMALFTRLDRQKIRPEIVFIDGNHDFEFASFDLQAAARRVKRSGFIFVNSIAQAGPYFAAMDFLATHPGWHSCGGGPLSRIGTRAFDRTGTAVENTDLFVLRAPSEYLVGTRPDTFGEMEWPSPAVNGVKVSIGGGAKAGTLAVQCVLRSSTETKVAEAIGDATKVIDGRAGDVEIAFDRPVTADLGFDRHRVELWLAWLGDDSLSLKAVPQPF